MPATGKGKTLIGIVGAGGCAREVMPIARAAYGHEAELVFVESDPLQDVVNGMRVFSEKQFIESSHERKLFNVAINDSRVRCAIAERLEQAGCIPQTFSAPSVITYENNEIGAGAILCANVVITSNVRIGRFFHANMFSYVTHDCEIGDYVTFAPRVSCNGNVKIGDHAYIGCGALLKQGAKGAPLVIGEGAIVGMGAVVTKSVAPYTTVVGNPARTLEKH